MSKIFLSIDTTSREKVILTIIRGNKENCFKFPTQDQSKDLLVRVDRVLKKEKIQLKDLQAILVNSGPGSFTGVRVGVTTANALAWTLNIPVWGFSNRLGSQEKIKLYKTKPKKFSKIVLPCYD